MDIKYWAHRVMLQEREQLERQEEFEAEFVSIEELADDLAEEGMPFSDRHTPIDKLIERWPDEDK